MCSAVTDNKHSPENASNGDFSKHTGIKSSEKTNIIRIMRASVEQRKKLHIQVSLHSFIQNKIIK